MLTGHGKTSKTRTYVNYSALRILLPTKIGSQVWMEAHNYIVKDLCLAQTSEDMDKVFQKFATQPSSVLVSNLHYPGNISISHQSCQKASERQTLMDKIHSIEQMATESPASWELLEAKIFSAPDILMHSCAERRAYDLLHTYKTVRKFTVYCLVTFFARDPPENAHRKLL